MCLGVRAGSEWTAPVTIVPIELDEGPGPEMDMGWGIRTFRIAVTLELVVARHPDGPSGHHSTPAAKGGPARRGSYSCRMPTLPDGATPRRYELAVRSCLCHRCGRRLVARTSKPGSRHDSEVLGHGRQTDNFLSPVQLIRYTRRPFHSHLLVADLLLATTRDDCVHTTT
jgi:hypothetical protein